MCPWGVPDEHENDKFQQFCTKNQRNIKYRKYPIPAVCACRTCVLCTGAAGSEDARKYACLHISTFGTNSSTAVPPGMPTPASLPPPGSEAKPRAPKEALDVQGLSGELCEACGTRHSSDSVNRFSTFQDPFQFLNVAHTVPLKIPEPGRPTLDSSNENHQANAKPFCSASLPAANETFRVRSQSFWLLSCTEVQSTVSRNTKKQLASCSHASAGTLKQWI